MLFKEFGDKSKEAVVLLHGGGLSWWQWQPQIDALQNDYRIITPIIDGHGEDFETTFISIEDSAKKLIEFIDKECGGKVLALCGLSIGAQIVVEVLANAPNSAQFALIESALVYPMKYAHKSAKLMYDTSYGLIKKRWFSKLQAKTLFVGEDNFERYYEESSRMSKESLVNVALSNSDYPLPESVSEANVKALVVAGGKEIPIMKKSAVLLKDKLKDSELMILEGYGHGELSLKNTGEYSGLLLELMKNK